MTKVFFEKYGKHDTIAIWNVDEDGNKLDERPIISFGKKKAQAIVAHMGEILGFAKEE